MKSAIVYLFIVFIISACSATRDIPGEYSSSRIPYSFELNKDSTYAYRYQFTFDTEHSSGKWGILDKNKIMLSSQINNRVLDLNVRGNRSFDNSEGLSFRINTPGFDRQYYRCLVFVNEALYANENCDPVVSLRTPKSIQNIYFGFTADRTAASILASRALDTLYTEKFSSLKDGFNEFEIDVVYNDSLFNYRVFNNEIVEITRKGLKFYDPKRRTRQTIPKNARL